MLVGAFLVELICFGSNFQFPFLFSMHSLFFFLGNGKIQYQTLKTRKVTDENTAYCFLPGICFLEFAYLLAKYLFIRKIKCLPVRNLSEVGLFKSWGWGRWGEPFGHFIPSKSAVPFHLID